MEDKDSKKPRRNGRIHADRDLSRPDERYLSHLVDLYQYRDFRGMGISDRLPPNLSLLISDL